MSPSVNNINSSSPKHIARVPRVGQPQKDAEEIFDGIRRHFTYAPVESEPLFVRSAVCVSGAISRVLEECARLGKGEGQVKR